MFDREYELRRLRRHLNVQENRVRAAGISRDKLRRPSAPQKWRDKAEQTYREAVEGRDGFLKMIKELEAEINGEAENKRSENGSQSDEEAAERTKGQPDRPSTLCDRKEAEAHRSPAQPPATSEARSLGESTR